MARSFRSNFAMIFGFFLLSISQISLGSIVSTGDFDKDFFVTWSPDHVNTSSEGKSRTLMLDQDSGAGFASNDLFMFGQFDMKIKLIPDYSAGTVVAFYLTSSDKPNRDELDFEFLGNVNGKPYILQTNIFVEGFDNKEERIRLWFDPTEDFHTYSILWNVYQIVFMVDWVPIRTYRNHEDKGVAFPRWQPMGMKVSIWNGESWATRGGMDKVDWSKGPFVASFRDHKIDACVWRGDNVGSCMGESPTNWWNKDRFNSLTWTQRRLFKWVRKYHLIYDYCQDNNRFLNNMPKECSLPDY